MIKEIKKWVNVQNENIAAAENKEKNKFQQMDLFTNYQEADKIEKQKEKDREEEKQLQKAMIDIKRKYGKNAVLKGMNFLEGGTTRDRNEQIGGHKE